MRHLHTRPLHGIITMASLLQDFRYGFRMLLKTPGFTLVARAHIYGRHSREYTVFSCIETVLLRPLPGVMHSEELVAFETTTPNGGFVPTSYPDYRDFREHLTLVSRLAMATPSAFSMGEPEQAERVWCELVSGNYSAVLAVKPLLGRSFRPRSTAINRVATQWL